MLPIMCLTCPGSCGHWWASSAVFSALTEQGRNRAGRVVTHTWEGRLVRQTRQGSAIRAGNTVMRALSHFRSLKVSALTAKAIAVACGGWSSLWLLHLDAARVRMA